MTDFVCERLIARSYRDLALDLEKGLDKSAEFEVIYQPCSAMAEESVGRFTLSPMPGCCGVVVSIHSYLNRKHPILGSNFHKLKAKVAKDLGYSRMLATTQTSNFPELIGAAKNGWRLHEAFINKRTNQQLTVMEKAL